MIAMTGKPAGPLYRLFGGKRAGTTLMIVGVAGAVLAFLLVLRVFGSVRQEAKQTIPQVYVVTASRDIPQFTAITADALSVKAFPAAFAPPGAAAKIEDLSGKFAAATITRDQIVLTSQVSATRRTSNLSATIPPGKVGFWMPLPELLLQSGGLQAGDHVDVLLSLELTMRGTTLTGQTQEVTSISTQNTLQNVEVFFAGAATNADLPDGAAPATASASGGATGIGGAAKQPAKVVVFLLDPQDAVLAKWVKDSGGTIDLVLRSDQTTDSATTESVNADTVIERFKFRVPGEWSTRRR